MRHGNSIGTISYAVTVACIYVLCLIGCASGDDGSLTIITSSLPNGTVNQPYSAAVSGSGGLPPYTWSVEPALPPNLSFDTQTGAITGTPVTVGTTSHTFTLQDSLSPPQAVQKSLTLTIHPPLSITTTSLPAGTVGQAYDQSVVATGGSPPLTWSIEGALPQGLSPNQMTDVLVISGTPTTAGTSTFSVHVKDTAGAEATQSLSITVNSPILMITTTSLPIAKVGTPYSTTLQRSGGVGPFTWSVAPALPNGLNLNASTGTIAGTPAAGTAGTKNFTFTVKDSSTPMQTASKLLSLTVNP